MVSLSDADAGLFVPGALRPLTLTYDGRTYTAIDANGGKSRIPTLNLDNALKGVSPGTLKKMTEVGYVSVKRSGEEYALNYNGRLLGGGLFSAIAVYAGTNVLGGAMFLTGALLTPVGGVGIALMAAGTATIAAAPTTFLVTLPVPAP